MSAATNVRVLLEDAGEAVGEVPALIDAIQNDDADAMQGITDRVNGYTDAMPTGTETLVSAYNDAATQCRDAS